MKNFILSILIAFVANTSFAQTFNMTWSEQQKFPEGDDYIEKILYADKDNFFFDYSMRGVKNGYLKINFHTVNKMSIDFKTIKSDKIFPDKKAKNVWEVINNVDMDSKSIHTKGGFFVFVKDEEKSVNNFGIIKYNTNGVVSEPILINSLNKDEWENNMKYNYVVSPDGSKIAIITERYAENNKGDNYWPSKKQLYKLKKFNVVVLNNDGEKLWEKTIELKDVDERNFIIGGAAVNSRGDVYLSAKKFPNDDIKNINDDFDKIKEYNKDKTVSVYYETVVYDISNNGSSEKLIKISNLNIGSLAYKINPITDNFIAVGSFNDKYDIPTGLFYAEINSNGELIHNIQKPLPDSYISVIKEREASSDINEKNRFINRFVNVNDILFNGKNIAVIAEYNSIYTYDKPSNFGLRITRNWVASRFANYSFYPPVFSYSYNYIYIYDDIYAIKIDVDKNDIIYQTRIPKMQRTNDEYKTLESYCAYLNNKIYIFRNYMSEFEGKGLTDKSMRELFKLKTKNAELVVDIIDDKGNFTTKSIYKKSERDRLIYPSNLKAISPNKFLFTAADTKGRGFFQSTDYFGTIEIKE